MTPMEKRLHQYKALMTECKIRLEVIHVLLSQPKGLPTQVVGETCYLQLRMMCETIAVGCLVLHGDIPATRSGKLYNTWEADKIIKKLETLHPDFYPKPTNVTEKEWGVELTPRDETQGLTQQDLPVLYHKCNERLHKGSLKRLFSGKPVSEMQPAAIGAWQKKIFHLLDIHIISSFDPGAVYLVAMRGENGEVQAAFAQPTDLQTIPAA